MAANRLADPINARLNSCSRTVSTLVSFSSLTVLHSLFFTHYDCPVRPVKYSTGDRQDSGQSSNNPPTSTSSISSSARRNMAVCCPGLKGSPKLFPMGKFRNRLLGGFTCAVRSLPVDTQTVGMPASSTTRHTRPTVWWSRGQAGAVTNMSTASSLSFSMNAGMDCSISFVLL